MISFAQHSRAKSARMALWVLRLKDALVAQGMLTTAAEGVIALAVAKLRDCPVDTALVQRVLAVFGRAGEAARSSVRYTRVLRRDGPGTVLVFSAIDLVMQRTATTQLRNRLFSASSRSTTAWI